MTYPHEAYLTTSTITRDKPDRNPPSSPSVVAGLTRLFEAKQTAKLTEDLNHAYPEPSDLQFLNPEPVADIEAHLKTSKAFVALKADTSLVKLAELQSLLTRPLAEAMSHLAESPDKLDPKVLAERLSDIAKLNILALKQNEQARIEVACAAFKVPTSAAKTERGVSLLGPSFAKNVERLRKDKKTLVGEEHSSTGYNRTPFRPYNKQTDRSTQHRTPWKSASNWNSRQQMTAKSTAPPRNRTAGPSTPSAGTHMRSISCAFSEWQAITTDKWVLKTVRGYQIEFETLPVQSSPPHTINFTTQQEAVMAKEIDTLLDKGAITHIHSTQTHFTSNLFLVAKKGTDAYRPVINLRRLNEHIADAKFKMEGWNDVKQAISPNCWFARIDLRDAFLSIPLHERSQPFLAFQWKQTTFCWTRLPFGLKTSPRVFTKLMKPVVACLRREGIMVVVYLDDFLLIADSISAATAHVARSIDLLQRLGYTVNFDKSALVPSQRVTFLGYNIDSTSMLLSVPDVKRDQIKEELLSLSSRTTITRRTLSRMLGKLNAITTIVRSLRYHCAPLATWLSHTTRANHDLDAQLHVSNDTRQDFLWWFNHLDTIAIGPVHYPIVSMEITTDSSLVGWGAWTENEATGGTWGPSDSHLHINALELKAILLAVQHFAANCSNTTIAIRTDNTNAMHCINNFGSIRSPVLNSLTRTLWAWAFTRNLYITATYIPGILNDMADTLSRTVLDNYSYSLHGEIFNQLHTAHGPFEVDLFADFSNYKVRTYISWVADPFAWSIDAFTTRWDTWTRLYAFPPFKLIDRVLTHLDAFPTSELTLISPLWPTQPVFPRLLQRCIAPPLLLPARRDLLKDRSGDPHPLIATHKLQLIAWHLAPRSCPNKQTDFWRTLSESQLGSHMKFVGTIGFVGAPPTIPLPLLAL